MAVYKGKSGIVKSGTTAVAQVREFTVNTTGETADSTHMGDTWRTHEFTFSSWEATITALYDQTDAGQTAFAVGASITANLFVDGDAAGKPRLTGTATVTGREITSEYEGIVEIAMTVAGNGTLTEDVVPA